MTKDIAKEHRISQSLVRVIISKAKRKPKFIKELFSNDDIKEQKLNNVDKVIKEMTDKDVFIDSCQSVMKKVNENSMHRCSQTET